MGLLVYWGIIITSIPDYWLRPRLMKGHMRLHELLVLIAVFGGIEAFGAIGILIGPMFVAMFVASCASTSATIACRRPRGASTRSRASPPTATGATRRARRAARSRRIRSARERRA